MAEGAPLLPLVETSAFVEASQVSGVDVTVPEAGMPGTDGEAGTSLRSPLPDLAAHGKRMANGGIVRGEIVPAVVPRGEYL